MEKMKVEVTSRKTIKPSIPTPHHLRTFNLSLLDQDVPAIHYGSVVFFYPSDNTAPNVPRSISQKSQSLKNSLSKILLHFYPLAGQVKDAVTIDCNDQGACFIEARTGCQLKDFLTHPDPGFLKELVPSTDPKTIRSTLACILLVQLTSFTCGGTAVAVCVSHKFADASSLCTFIQSWTAMSSREYGRVVVPKLVGASLLPPIHKLITSTPPPTTRNCTTKRFVFRKSQIANLKAKVAATMGQKQRPANVEIVLAIILRGASAASQSKYGSSRQSALLNVVNLRKRMVPPLPGNTIGNLIWTYPVLFEESDVQLHQIVAKMKDAFTNVCNDKVKIIKSKKGHTEVQESRKQIAQLLNGKLVDTNTYTCTNLCSYPLHEMDFGWGKPLWVTSPSNFKNLIVLLDSKWGDIEAWVTLDELEMAIFERDQELLAVASSNPSAIVSYSRM
ncbi:salutaridinol 7-O-acetyltransferase-like [Herrania umbratica]|uniref:Salutaridinol 7-O-acetyltransferase-like n=1 Tax=Herrania umbratica TaxID=108875 RepID=A0A6J1BDR3_9ROSI|nr:salutaridinol 7-O-acetyltransferase-like [Herrania umbratica]